MVQANVTPPPGTYVEVILRSTVIVARTIWQGDGACGLRTQDTIDLQGVLTGEWSQPPQPVRAMPRGRTVTRHQTRLSSSDAARRASSAMQFGFALLIGGAAAASLGWEVYQTLAAPMTTISTAMEGSHDQLRQ
jgi:hypothetical protein